MLKYIRQTSQQPSGTLSILTVPDRAKVFIDGIEQFETTPTFIDLPIGTHIYRLILAGYVDEEGIVLIEEGKTSNLFKIMKTETFAGDLIVYGFAMSMLTGATLYVLIKIR